MGHLVASDIVSSRSNRPPQADLAVETGSFAEARRSQPIPIRNLRPTQMTVGYREVTEKRRRWRMSAAADAFRSLIVPVVLGPGGQNYILDRHHGLCALAAAGVAEVQVSIVDDLRSLEWVAFWRTLDRRGWCRPRDAEGQRQDYSYIPTTIDGLVDDPFRSLARALRRAGGYAKQKAPFSDFVWADFLRDRVPRTLVNDDFEAALRAALALARNGGPSTNPLLQAAKIGLLPKIPGLPTRAGAPELPDPVSTETTRERTSTGHDGAVT